MIRLYETLPTTISVGGRDFLIKTDYRYWILFSDMITESRPLSDYTFLFEGEIPEVDFFDALLGFYINENSTPTGEGSSSSERLFDYIEDGEYIYASFMACYGIDLLDVQMHWWKFKALFLGLPDDSKIKQIMGFRGYRKETRSQDTLMQLQKRAWTLPNNTEKELLDELDELFYGC